MNEALTGCANWRSDAVKIVEDLFPRVGEEHWDLLLELRGLLSSGKDWESALDVFLVCRQRMEADHYLPFYRLRTLLCGSLRLELEDQGQEGVAGSLGALLRRGHRSLACIRRAVERDLFEAAVPEFGAARLRVVEAAPAA